MEMTGSVTVRVAETSGVAAARRAATIMASAAGLAEGDIGRVALVTTEAATNLVKHAGGGEILLRPLVPGPGVEVLAIDGGRGMANLGSCLRDGFSTAGSPGTGLGAIGRVADLVDIHSAEGAGTVLVAQVTADGIASRATIDVAAVCVPHPAEVQCGDSWASVDRGGVTTILVVDGLGHGALAHAAARTALESFANAPTTGPVAVVEMLHDALRSTRGAALAVAELDAAAGTVRFCGLGNIKGAILHVESDRRMVSHNGTAGHQLHRIQQFAYPWPDGGVVVLHTDGVMSQWDLSRHPGLLSMRHPAVIAGLIYRDFRRLRDDATIVAARRTPRRARAL